MAKVWHVVLYQAKPGHEEALAAALAAARVRLIHEVPGFLDFRSGRDFGGRAGGFTNCIVAQFADRAALENRVNHEAHRVLRETTQPHVASSVVFDFEE
jgi:heme-degrading monooxygenase HmoA